MKKKLIVLELNEVPYRVIDQFIADHPASSFAKLMPTAARLHAMLPDQGQLHPKISWQTFHRGVPDTVHGYREYNQTDAQGREANPTFLELARRAGRRVGCGASIGVWPAPGASNDGHFSNEPTASEQAAQDNIAFWLCDPFAPTPESLPRELESFQRFNISAVQRSSRNVRTGGLDKATALDLLKRLPRLGIRASTCGRVVKQLIDERCNRVRTVRRRNVQAMLTFDVVDAQIRRTQPDIATVFLNHVAAAMHRYWAAAFPNDYNQNNMPVDWRATYVDEIGAAMRSTDVMLARLLDTAQKIGARVVVVGSMGQAGIEHEVTRNQLVVEDIDKFMQILGFKPDDYERRPGMEPEYPIAFRNAALLDAFESACDRLDIDGTEPEIKRSSDAECTLMVDLYNVDFDHVEFEGQRFSLNEAGLKIEAIDDFAGSTAQHVPEGICLVIDPEHDLSALSDNALHDLNAVTASLLSALEVPVPDYMSRPVASLVEVFGGTWVAESESHDNASARTKAKAKLSAREMA